MSLRADELKRVLADADHPLGVKELLRLSGLNPGQQTALKQALRELVRSGVIEKQGKRFSLPGKRAAPAPGKAGRAEAGKGPRVEGTLHLHRDGYGFVHPEGEGDNVFLPPEQARRAMDNDRVQVEVVPARDGRSAGRLVKVLERRRQLVVGTYVDRPRGTWVEPRDESIGGVIQVPRTQLARDGDQVKVRLGVGAALLKPGEGLFGEVAGSLGKPGDPSVEVLSIAFAQGFNDEFPAEVMDQADGIPLSVSPQEASGREGDLKRRDLRDLQLVTIDGEDARDFDDAIYVEPRAGGWRLVVAIADVTHYVSEGSALDVEALRRATSVYLPDRVLPMLPERLSTGICSLRPDEDRLCMVADMQLSSAGELGEYELYPAVMRSAARCTYGEVHRVLAGEDVPHRNAFRPLFERAMTLSRALTRMRRARGAIDFDIPESRVELDEEGKPVRMVRRERLESHRLVEECMLAANEAVARFFQEKGLPSVYRFHGEPHEEKLAAFAALAGVHGFTLGSRGPITSGELNALLEELEGHPEQRALNQLLLRSMMQAVYSAESVGHYGLAAENYLHFTSPIRRYPDLLVHRLLKANWRRKGKGRPEHELEAETEHLAKMAAQSSERERAAMLVEREVVSFYAALMLEDRVGEELAGTVSSIAEFGFFVDLDGLFIEGLVKGETVEPRFRFDPLTYALVFGSGRRVRVGAKVRVRISSVSVQRRQIDLEALSFDEEPVKPLAPRQPGRAGPARGQPPRAQPGRAGPPREQPPRGQPGRAGPPRGQPPREHPGRARPPRVQPPSEWARTPGPPPPAPEEAAAAEERPRSPHPGFDRLRALAGKSSQAAPVARPKGQEPRSKDRGRPDGKKKSPGSDRGGRFKGRRR